MFQVSDAFLYRLGWIFLFLCAISLVASFFAIRLTMNATSVPNFKASHSEPKELEELRERNKVLEEKLKAVPTEPEELNAKPIPWTQKGFPLSLFPIGVSTMLAGGEIPIQLTEPTLESKNGSVTLNFALQYSRNDGGTFRGRLGVLASAPGNVFTYPRALMDIGRLGNSWLIPENLENFSVSRFRAVTANFSQLSSEDLSHYSFFVLITDRAGTPIVAETLPVKMPAKAGTP